MRVMRPVSKSTPITSAFGQIDPGLRDNKPHKGVDFGCPIGTPVWACFDGTIQVVLRAEEPAGDTEEAQKQRRAGNRIALVTEDGSYRALYFHLSKFNVKVGDKVKKGDVIGFSGDTGHVTGPHLHFQMNQVHVPIKPEFDDEIPLVEENIV